MNCPTLSFPESFFNEEVRAGHTVASEQKKIWAVELDLLEKLQQVCKKYDIHYFADAGSMLGVVRHQGFIPWDDDVDISMFREEYNKLCKIASKEFQYPYFFQTEYSDPGSMRGHAQLRNCLTTGILVNESAQKYSFNQGIFIDIFPLDAIPDEKDSRAKFIKKTDRLRELAQAYSRVSTRFDKRTASVKKKIAYYTVGKWIKKNPFYRIYEKTLQKYNKSGTAFVANLFIPNLQSSFIYDKRWIKDTVERPYEMLMVPIPIGHMEYLRNRYGNWETPVKGGSLHGGVIFDTEKSYLDYFSENE